MIEENRGLGHAEPLRTAISQGLQTLDCTIVQIPSDSNGQHAVVLATVTTGKGLVFRAVGEASRDALPEACKYLVLTVAESRAKARVLAEATGMPDDVAGRPADESETDLCEDVPGGAEPAARPEPVLGIHLAARDGDTEDGAPVPGSAEAEIASEPELRSATEPVAGPEMQPPAVPARAGWPEGSTRAPIREAVPVQSPVKPAGQRPVASAQLSEELGPDVLARLLHLTRKKAESEGAAITEEEAMRRLDSYFQRAFGHAVSQGTRVEGQRVIQRLTSDLSRLPAGRAGLSVRG